MEILGQESFNTLPFFSYPFCTFHITKLQLFGIWLFIFCSFEHKWGTKFQYPALIDANNNSPLCLKYIIKELNN